MKIFFTSCFILIAAIISSCKQTPTTENEAPAPDVIQPLAVGNRWIYEIAGLDSAGRKELAPNDTDLVTNDKFINGERWYILNNAKYGLFINKPGGLYCQHPSFPNVQLVAKYPAVSGDSFICYAAPYKVLATDTLITIPSGQYKCYCYSTEIQGGDEYDFECPNIGTIKREAYFTTPGGKKYLGFVATLLEYKIK